MSNKEPEQKEEGTKIQVPQPEVKQTLYAAINVDLKLLQEKDLENMASKAFMAGFQKMFNIVLQVKKNIEDEKKDVTAGQFVRLVANEYEIATGVREREVS